MNADPPVDVKRPLLDADEDRRKLDDRRSCLKNQIHAVLAGARVTVPMSDLFGAGGRGLLAATQLAVESRSRVDSLLRVITALDFEIDLYAKLVGGRLHADPGYQAIQQIPGVLSCPILAVGPDRAGHDPLYWRQAGRRGHPL